MLTQLVSVKEGAVAVGMKMIIIAAVAAELQLNAGTVATFDGAGDRVLVEFNHLG